MCKAVDRGMTMTDVKPVRKAWGKEWEFCGGILKD
jgi:molybdenum cofactor biosynthesis enzyme